MTEDLSDFQKIDKFLTLARTIDTFQHCQDIFDVLDIKDKNASYFDIEKQINQFVGKWSGTNAAKYKIFGKAVGDSAETIKRVLKERGAAYHDYLFENRPKVKELKIHFKAYTKDGELTSTERKHLFEEAKSTGLLENDVVLLIDRWLAEFNVKEVASKRTVPAGDPAFVDKRKGKWLKISMVFVVLIGLFSTFLNIVREQKKTLKIEGTPLGTEIAINDEYKGVVPLEIKLKTGKVNVALKRQGYQEKKETINLNSDQVFKFFLPKIETAKLSISNSPAASVFLNGKLVSQDSHSSREIEKGTYEIELKKEGYKTIHETITLDADKELSFKLQPEANDSDAKSTTSDITDKSVRSLIEKRLEARNRNDISSMLDCYADQVSYDDNMMRTKESLRKTWENNANKFSQIRQVLKSDITTSAGPQKGTKKAVFYIDTTANSLSKKSHLYEYTKKTMVVTNIDGELKIIDEKQEILKQKLD
jgi:hypothetical protein